MTDNRIDEDDEFYSGTVGYEPPRQPGSVGYGKPPQEHKFRPGQSGNIYGRPRKRRRPEPPGDLMAAVMEALNEPVSIKFGGKVVQMKSAQAIAKMLVGDMSKDPLQRHRTVSLLDRMGVFHAADTLAEMRHEQETAATGGWTPEMEARFQKINEEFFEAFPEERENEERERRERGMDGPPVSRRE